MKRVGTGMLEKPTPYSGIGRVCIMQWGRIAVRLADRKADGFTLIEVLAAAAIMAILFLALAGAFSSNLMAVSMAKNMTQASMFLETVMENLSVQPYENLLVMNGNQFFSQTNANDSRYIITLTVFPAAVDLLQIRATLTDTLNNMEVGRVITHRSRR
jgi:prepilin-type N-terminal cleavage/methylation domain-containing protein